MTSIWLRSSLPWPLDCTRCDGTGYVLSGGQHGMLQRCPDCDGSGSRSRYLARRAAS